MNNFYFNIGEWLMWREILFWSVSIVGFLSTISAFLFYHFKPRNRIGIMAWILFIGMLILLGLFPIEWGLGTDRSNYAIFFSDFKSGHQKLDLEEGEYGYQLINYVLSRFLDVKEFMFAISLIYLTNYLIAIKRTVQGNSYWLLLASILSMGFINYNLNTMRAGLALSFVVLALSMYKSLWKLLLLLLVATSIHTSSIIPGVMILVCRSFNKTSWYYRLWILSIPLSFIADNFFNKLFEGLGGDERTLYLVTTDTNYNVGFRFDFILYSLAPMAVGAYYIFRKKFNDRFYSLVYNVYLLTNLFWILVIRANYSDRFAYLSWFLIPFVLTYPLLKTRMHNNQGYWLGIILLGENLFRFLF